MPLCARCIGIAFGHVAALLTAPFHSFDYSIAALIVPLVIDGTVQYCTSYESNNKKRAITGFLYGFAFTSVTIRIIRAILERHKGHSSGNSHRQY